MYINEIHILAYVITIILGFAIGHTIKFLNEKIIDNKGIFTKQNLIQALKNFLKYDKTNYINAAIVIVLYIIVLCKNGLNKEWIENINLIKSLVLIPVLISIIEIDYKEKIIPNRLTLFLFEAGIIFTFIYSVNSLFIARDYLIAMVLGFAIFGIIALLGRLIAGKEAMGMGDVKLLATLGLFFGIPLTIATAIISFIISAIFGIIILLRKKKQNLEYVPFGPSIGIAAILCIVIPENVIISVLLTIFTLGKVKR